LHSFGDTDGRLIPVDRAVLAYLLFGGILVAVFLPLASGKLAVLGLHVLAAIFILAVSRADLSRIPGLRFLREAYPFLMLFPFYREVETLNRLISDRYYDAWLLPVEEFLFFGQPSMYLVEKLPWIWFSEIVNFVYFAYLLLIPGLMFPLYFLKRVRGFREATFLILAAYFSCFVIFTFFPMESPNFLFPKITGPTTEWPMYQLVHSGMQKGVTKGAAFPSSHVAMATVAAWCAYRYFKPLFLLYAFLAPAIGFATVYCRLHYAVDAVAGLLFGLFAAYAGEIYLRRWQARHPDVPVT
jgi:membrane-associated phospholipid phosphatase